MLSKNFGGISWAWAIRSAVKVRGWYGSATATLANSTTARSA